MNKKLFLFSLIMGCFFSNLGTATTGTQKSREEIAVDKIKKIFEKNQTSKRTPPLIGKDAQNSLDTLMPLAQREEWWRHFLDLIDGTPFEGQDTFWDELNMIKGFSSTNVEDDQEVVKVSPIKTCGSEPFMRRCQEGEKPFNLNYHLYVPKNFRENVKRGKFPPVVFSVYGGGVVQEFNKFHNSILTSLGCVVVELVDEKNLEDIKNSEAHINYKNFPERFFMDIRRLYDYLMQDNEEIEGRYIWPRKTKVFLTGGSFGGYTTLLVATVKKETGVGYLAEIDNIFDGFIPDMGVYDWVSRLEYGFIERENNFDIESIREFNFETRKPEELLDHQHIFFFKKNYVDDPTYNKIISPIYHLDNLQKPVLSLHGIKDIRVAAHELVELHKKAEEAHKDYLFRIAFYKTAAHSDPNSREELKNKYEQIITFIEDVIAYGRDFNLYASWSSTQSQKPHAALSLSPGSKAIELLRGAANRAKGRVADKDLLLNHIYVGNVEKIKQVLMRIPSSADSTKIKAQKIKAFLNEPKEDPRNPGHKVYPLQIAHDHETIRLLLENGARFDPKSGTSANTDWALSIINLSILYYITVGDMEKITQILETIPSPTDSDKVRTEKIKAFLNEPKNDPQNPGQKLYLLDVANDEGIIKMLMAYGARGALKDKDILLSYIYAGDSEKIKRILETIPASMDSNKIRDEKIAAFLNEPKNDPRNPGHKIYPHEATNNWNIIKLLLKKGADLNLKSRNSPKTRSTQACKVTCTDYNCRKYAQGTLAEYSGGISKFDQKDTQSKFDYCFRQCEEDVVNPKCRASFADESNRILFNFNIYLEKTYSMIGKVDPGTICPKVLAVAKRDKNINTNLAGRLFKGFGSDFHMRLVNNVCQLVVRNCQGKNIQACKEDILKRLE